MPRRVRRAGARAGIVEDFVVGGDDREEGAVLCLVDHLADFLVGAQRCGKDDVDGGVGRLRPRIPGTRAVEYQRRPELPAMGETRYHVDELLPRSVRIVLQPGMERGNRVEEIVGVDDDVRERVHPIGVASRS